MFQRISTHDVICMCGACAMIGKTKTYLEMNQQATLWSNLVIHHQARGRNLLPWSWIETSNNFFRTCISVQEQWGGWWEESTYRTDSSLKLAKTLLTILDDLFIFQRGLCVKERPKSGVDEASSASFSYLHHPNTFHSATIPLPQEANEKAVPTSLIKPCGIGYTYIGIIGLLARSHKRQSSSHVSIIPGIPFEFSRNRIRNTPNRECMHRTDNNNTLNSKPNIYI